MIFSVFITLLKLNICPKKSAVIFPCPPLFNQVLVTVCSGYTGRSAARAKYMKGTGIVTVKVADKVAPKVLFEAVVYSEGREGKINPW